MQFLRNLSVKQQLILSLVLATLLATAIMGTLSYQQARQVVVSRMLHHEMPALVEQVGQRLDAQIREMTTATQQLAENPYFSANAGPWIIGHCRLATTVGGVSNCCADCGVRSGVPD